MVGFEPWISGVMATVLPAVLKSPKLNAYASPGLGCSFCALPYNDFDLLITFSLEVNLTLS